MEILDAMMRPKAGIKENEDFSIEFNFKYFGQSDNEGKGFFNCRQVDFCGLSESTLKARFSSPETRYLWILSQVSN